MKLRDRKALGKYIRHVANEMGLRDWEFVLSHDPPSDDDCLADVTPTNGRKQAVIAVCVDFRTRSADTQRSTIVHELIHCHTAQWWQFCREMAGPLAQPTYDLWIDNVRSAMEYAVDGMAVEWARKLPLIGWPK